MLLPFWSVALAAGIATGISAGGPWFFGFLGLTLLGGGALVVLRRAVLGGASLALGLGAALGHQAARPASLPPPIVRAVDGGGPVELRVRLVRAFRQERKAGPAGTRFLADLLTVAGAPAAARALVTLPPPRGDLLPGDRVRFRARLSLPTGLANPGLPDPDLRIRASGIDLLATASGDEPLVVEQVGGRLSPRRLAHLAHAVLTAAIADGVRGPQRGLLQALVLGDRFAAGEEAEAGFRAAGALHVLSVSGLHLTAVAGVLFLIVRRLLIGFPWIALRVRPDVVAALACLPALGFYTLLTGEAVATARAAWMGGLAFGAIALRRPPSVATAIAGAAVVLLLGAPLLLIDVSFQLSFAGVIALAVVARTWPDEPAEPRGALRRMGRWLVRGGVASVAAFLVTAPLGVHHFAEIAPAAPLGNLLLVPPLELGALPLGLAGSTLGAIHPVLGWVPLKLAGALAAAALWIAGGFRTWAPVIPLMSPGLAETALIGLGVLLILVAAGRPIRRRLLLVAGLLVLLGVAAMGIRRLVQRSQTDLRVTFLDVGQGDAALVEAPGGFTVLIDGGGALTGSFDPGARVVGPVLRRKGIGRIDLLVLSHAHPDHMTGLFHLIAGFEVGALWTPGEGGGNPEYDRLLALAKARGVTVAEPGSFTRGPLTVQARGPLLGEAVRAPPGLSVNDASLVLRIGFSGRWILLTGDIESQGEAELVAGAAFEPLESDVLKVPHHGSRTSSSDALLAAVRPALAVISLGRRNRFGFPRAEVLARYASRGIKLLRTDWHGAVTVAIEPDGEMQTTCARSCR